MHQGHGIAAARNGDCEGSIQWRTELFEGGSEARREAIGLRRTSRRGARFGRAS
jgi:hypothetical protein